MPSPATSHCYFPLTTYKSRLKKLRAKLAAADFEALLVTNPTDVRYLSPFCGDSSYALITASSYHILSDFRFQEELGAVKGLAKVVIRKGDMIEALRELLAQVRPANLAIQSEHCTASLKNNLTKAVGARKLRDSSGLISGLRIFKDEHELAAIRASIKIQEQSLLATLKTIKPGQTELAIAARLEFEMKVRGSVKPAFDSIVAARANGSLPHASPGTTTTAKGQPLLIDWGARAGGKNTGGGYCSDMTRTFCLGKWPAKMAEIYRVVLEAHMASVAAVAPGRSGEEVDKAGRDIIEKAGYGKHFGHGTGHGFGLDIHEDPRVVRGGRGLLQPGMVVTIEPGIYLPGIGGVRIEDDILVTERGGKGLCTLPKDIRWATL